MNFITGKDYFEVFVDTLDKNKYPAMLYYMYLNWMQLSPILS